MHAKNECHCYNYLLLLAQCRYTKIAQRTFKYSDIQYTSLTMDKRLNSLMYRTLFCVNIYRSYKVAACRSSIMILALSMRNNDSMVDIKIPHQGVGRCPLPAGYCIL